MVDTYQLIQLVAMADSRTLTKAADSLNLTQPALTRSMKKLEWDLGVSLFDREKNRIRLNENGKLAAELARKIISDINDMETRLQDFDRSRRTIAIASIAPFPVTGIIERLSITNPRMMISTEINGNEDEIIAQLQKNHYQIAITSSKPDIANIHTWLLGEEHLYFLLPDDGKEHKKSLSFADVNGRGMMILSGLGLWEEIARNKLPDSKFFMQTDFASLAMLVDLSQLVAFTTDAIIRRDGIPSGRIAVPISDEEASMKYYLSITVSSLSSLSSFASTIDKKQL